MHRKKCVLRKRDRRRKREKGMLVESDAYNGFALRFVCVCVYCIIVFTFGCCLEQSLFLFFFVLIFSTHTEECNRSHICVWNSVHTMMRHKRYTHSEFILYPFKFFKLVLFWEMSEKRLEEWQKASPTTTNTLHNFARLVPCRKFAIIRR